MKPEDGEVDRILDLGATLVVDLRKRPDNEWAVIADPEGNEFCVLTPYRQEFIGIRRRTHLTSRAPGVSP